VGRGAWRAASARSWTSASSIRRRPASQRASSAVALSRSAGVADPASRAAASAVDLAGRKQGLFELWDDCAEAGDPEVVAAVHAAGRMVIDFIRAHLPAGSAGAYTPAELAALARTRHSQAAFTPYE
jgi:hypothetical protein